MVQVSDACFADECGFELLDLDELVVGDAELVVGDFSDFGRLHPVVLRSDEESLPLVEDDQPDDLDAVAQEDDSQLYEVVFEIVPAGECRLLAGDHHQDHEVDQQQGEVYQQRGDLTELLR